jgi:hypothetical protein
LIFLQCDAEAIFTDVNQATLLGNGLRWELTRHPLPEE